jgi:hypothetical protein
MALKERKNMKRIERSYSCLMPVILVTQEAEIKRITIGSQQIVHKTPSGKHPTQNRCGGVVREPA